MPWLAAALGVFAGAALRSIILKSLVVLGIGFASFAGLDLLLTGLLNQVQSQFGSVGQPWISYLGLLRVDQAVSAYFSAFSIVVGMAGIRLVARAAT